MEACSPGRRSNVENAGCGLHTLLASDWRVTGGILKIARRIWAVGLAGSPVIGRRRGAFSTLLRRPGLRASSDGVLATKSERRMLASTCLYSLYAWFIMFITITFRASRRRREMYSGHARLCVCPWQGLVACPHYCTDSDVS